MAVRGWKPAFRCNVDAKLKNMMKDLGEAINQSISDSDDIADVISRIKAGGYDVFLVLEATIGFNQREPEDRAHAGQSQVAARL